MIGIKKGVCFVNDLLHVEGRLLTYEEFSKTFSIKTNFLTYESVKRAIMTYVRSLNINQFEKKLTNPIYSFNVSKVDTIIGSKSLYAPLVNSQFVRLASFSKWEKILQTGFDEKDWKIFNIVAHKCSKSTDLKWLQYRIIHNILPTRYLLYRIGYNSSPYCPFCQRETETINHMLWQ